MSNSPIYDAALMTVKERCWIFDLSETSRFCIQKKKYIEAFFSVSVHVRKTKSFKFLW